MRNVIVTGGSRGLGLAIARTLHGAGYRVIAVARSETPMLAALGGQLRDGDGAVHFMPCDLADLAAIPDLLVRIRKEFGQVYGLVNNAGLGTSGVLATMRDADIERLVRLNTVSPMILTKYAVRSMMAHGEGRIVNIGSIVAAAGYNGLSAYSATKASLVGFTRALAREVGKLNITVNTVAPGFVDTDLTDSLTGEQRSRIARRSALNRLIEVDDVANTVLFLIGEQARNITGTVLTVDAGGTA